MTGFRLLGTHAPERSEFGDDFFDAADLVLETDRGARVLGFRTAGYVARPADEWDGGYAPIPITLDTESVEFWDFGTVLWVGPDAHPCLVWSNAVGLSLRGIQHLVAPVGSGAILDGPDGRGLPTPDQLRIAVPDGAPVYRPLTL